MVPTIDRVILAGDFMGLHSKDLVIVPSMLLSPYELSVATSVQCLEERSLFYLLLLRDPSIRIFFVTSVAVDAAIVDNFMSLLEGMGTTDCRDRLWMMSPEDLSRQKLSSKVLSHESLLKNIRLNLRQNNAGLICAQSGLQEVKIADALGIPFLGNSPQNEVWGTKSGSRALFAEAGVAYANGTAVVHTVDDLAMSICKIYSTDQSFTKIMIKLDESFNGEGNAILNLESLGGNVNMDTVKQAFENMKLTGANHTWKTYSEQISAVGAIAERYLENEITSPSFIGFISNSGEVHRLGTQEQVLEGLEYMGCIFPANEQYRLRVQENGYLVGKALASKGAVGHFGVDFMVCKNKKNPSHPDIFAVEINLRHTGSTYPFMLAKLLTEGTLCPESGLLKSSKGQFKYYKSSSYVKMEGYKQLTPLRVLKTMKEHGLLFDKNTQTGVAFQMLGSIYQFGKFGMTCIGNSHEEAACISADVKNALEKEIYHPISKVPSI